MTNTLIFLLLGVIAVIVLSLALLAESRPNRKGPTQLKEGTAVRVHICGPSLKKYDEEDRLDMDADGLYRDPFMEALERKRNFYRVEKWLVGKQISAAEAARHIDSGTGELYVLGLLSKGEVEMRFVTQEALNIARLIILTRMST
jgi:hypothetical protein